MNARPQLIGLVLQLYCCLSQNRLKLPEVKPVGRNHHGI